MVYQKTKLVAVLPANRVGDKVYSHQGLTYGGLVYKSSLKSSDAILIWKTILNFLYDSGIVSLQVKELPYVYLKNVANNPLSYIFFILKAEKPRMDMHSILDLKHYKLSNSRKEGLKRGKKAGLRVQESESFDVFWNSILIPNLNEKHGIQPVHALDEIELLKSRFPNRIRQFNVYYNDNVIAGTTIFEMDDIAHCQYISGNETKNASGSLDFLHTYLITNEFQEKKYFSFGTSNINEGQNVNAGLQFWKEGFGARSVTQSFYEVQTKNYKLLDDVMS